MTQKHQALLILFRKHPSAPGKQEAGEDRTSLDTPADEIVRKRPTGTQGAEKLPSRTGISPAVGADAGSNVRGTKQQQMPPPSLGSLTPYAKPWIPVPKKGQKETPTTRRPSMKNGLLMAKPSDVRQILPAPNTSPA